MSRLCAAIAFLCLLHGLKPAVAGRALASDSPEAQMAQLQALINSNYTFRPTTWEEGINTLTAK